LKQLCKNLCFHLATPIRLNFQKSQFSKPFLKSYVFIDEDICFPSYCCQRSVKMHKMYLYVFWIEKGLVWKVPRHKYVVII
jgi:hypothetical protein